ncbi:hypothetical protein BK128_21345 [Viridibacillus sp. FSL H7-0596]|uniref:hypothetical protein n=1 Tax=Viridibacillus sp. FSL H7-0596 TaxID=1928923 RepID=UPI00096F8C10|nr:hypothetical protein [Viridibacillus sp. FSL H7-0596]OMC81818.1 hypothetical protein BK128_21345 [Viridibacillus sp. FSL H7-0596]
MNLFNGKGMSFNVNLSEEQMEALASLTADKVNLTKTHYVDETRRLQIEVDDLRNELRHRDRIIAQNAIYHEKRIEAQRKRNGTIKKLRAELAELKGE